MTTVAPAIDMKIPAALMKPSFSLNRSLEKRAMKAGFAAIMREARLAVTVLRPEKKKTL